MDCNELPLEISDISTMTLIQNSGLWPEIELWLRKTIQKQEKQNKTKANINKQNGSGSGTRKFLILFELLF